jgi:hypothetical protein
MASQVLSGSSNVSYTNTTGQNVRVVINFMAGLGDGGGNLVISMSWGGGSASGSSVLAIGRNLAFNAGYRGSIVTGTNPATMTANNMCTHSGSSGVGELTEAALPTEIMLANGQTFSASCGAYNIVVIPENG